MKERFLLLCWIVFLILTKRGRLLEPSALNSRVLLIFLRFIVVPGPLCLIWVKVQCSLLLELCITALFRGSLLVAAYPTSCVVQYVLLVLILWSKIFFGINKRLLQHQCPVLSIGLTWLAKVFGEQYSVNISVLTLVLEKQGFSLENLLKWELPYGSRSSLGALGLLDPSDTWCMREGIIQTSIQTFWHSLSVIAQVCFSPSYCHLSIRYLGRGVFLIPY